MEHGLLPKKLVQHHQKGFYLKEYQSWHNHTAEDCRGVSLNTDLHESLTTKGLSVTDCNPKTSCVFNDEE